MGLIFDENTTILAIAWEDQFRFKQFSTISIVTIILCFLSSVSKSISSVPPNKEVTS